MTENISKEINFTEINHLFPLKNSPLVQCITNTVTVETMANALLYIGAKPVMADQALEFDDFFSQNDALLLNMGELSPDRIQNILLAAKKAQVTSTPFVVDLVGVSASSLRYDLAHQIGLFSPHVIKGNISEMRRFCDLPTTGRGVDASEADQGTAAIKEVAQAMLAYTRQHPETLLLATGPIDLIVSKDQIYGLENGVAQLDQFTGTGDIVGAMIAALIGAGHQADQATIAAVTYFNLCGEKAASTTQGLADFRQATLNHLSLLMQQKDWAKSIKGGLLAWT